MSSRSSFRSILVVLGLLILIAVIVLGGAAAWGWNTGVVERQSLRATRAAEHYQKGLDAETNGQPEIARSEFDLVLRLDPSFPGVKEHLQPATPAIASSAALVQVGTPASAPMVVTPTPKSTLPVDQPAGPALLHEAQDLLDAGQVEQAVIRLEQVRSLEPNYEPEKVASLLFTAHVANGDLLANAGRSEEALRAYDAALSLQPGAVDVLAKRDMASIYGIAMASWGVDWNEVIQQLETIYSRNPDYADVHSRLALAYSGLGNNQLRNNNPCSAVDSFTRSLSYLSAADVADLRNEAIVRCRTATPTSDPSVVVTSSLSVSVSTPASIAAYGTIAFSSVEGGHSKVYFTDLNGKITGSIDNASQPAFSVDGNRIALHSLRNDSSGINVVGRDGSNWLRISAFTEDGQPSFAPDGGRVAFASNREGDRKWRLYIANAGALNTAQELGFGESPTWSPDGKSIAYRGCDIQGNHCGIWVKGSDGANAHALTEGGSDRSPAWSPSGGWIAFMSFDRTGNWQLYTVSIASREVNPVAPGPAVSGQPTWSPDGRSLAFLTNREGVWNIYVVSLVAGEPRKVLTIPGTLSDWMSDKLSWTR